LQFLISPPIQCGVAKILMVASEATPFAKTGGLADVVGALPKALVKAGEEVGVVIPLYRKSAVRGASLAYQHLRIGFGTYIFDANVLELVDHGVRFFFVQIPALFDRDGIYDEGGKEYPDNHIRYTALCHAALGVAQHLFRPDIIHGHDWQAGILPVLVRDIYAGHPAYAGIGLVFTIHNLGYQGRHWRGALYQMGLPDRLFRPDLLEYYGDINLLKAGIVYSHYLTTVSKTYAKEIQTPEYGFGLDGLLRARRDYLSGILNGVDYDDWNPATDKKIPKNYDVIDPAGKKECKRALLARMGLPERLLERPLVGIVSRFAAQKGFELLAQVADEFGSEDLGLAALGNGESNIEGFFRSFAEAYPQKIAVQLGYDDELAHWIEAGADLFLMPSRYEPCGLNQIYSLKYGTLPLVRATGGLEDTVDSSTGFKFTAYSGYELLDCVREAVVGWGSAGWKAKMEAAMLRDHSWTVAANEYALIYRRLLGSL